MKLNYILHLADNALVLGHRLSEWCGHGPVLEQDMAMTNIALDFIGQARLFYQYAADIQNETALESPQKAVTEDDLAYLRDVWDFKNALLVELPNRDFAHTIARQFLYDTYNFYFFEKLTESTDERLSAIAEKSLKEITYHLRWSSDWMIRLGDGTDESHQKIQQALNDLWPYSGELLTVTDLEKDLIEQGVAVNLNDIKPLVDKKRATVLAEATLKMPTDGWMQSGGKTGRHTEHLGFLLAEMQ
jgi:ring-1,2-phenylacetyl-CoA epoxidase subunit PaaC